MSQMDLLDTTIKGVTWRFIIWLLCSVGTAIVFVLVTFFSTIATIKASETKIMMVIMEHKAEQRLVDTIQNRRLSDHDAKLAKK